MLAGANNAAVNDRDHLCISRRDADDALRRKNRGAGIHTPLSAGAGSLVRCGRRVGVRMLLALKVRLGRVVMVTARRGRGRCHVAEVWIFEIVRVGGVHGAARDGNVDGYVIALSGEGGREGGREGGKEGGREGEGGREEGGGREGGREGERGREREREREVGREGGREGEGEGGRERGRERGRMTLQLHVGSPPLVPRPLTAR